MKKKSVKLLPQLCSICFNQYEGFGNNAQPISEIRCCDECNNLVIRARLNQRRNHEKN